MDTNIAGLWRFYKETALTLLLPGHAAAKRDALYSNSIFLIGNAGAGAALGFAFWVLAARLYPPESVGLASALLSAGNLLVFIAALGLGQGVIRYMSAQDSGSAAFINFCFTLGGLAAIVAALIFIAGIPLWSPALEFARGDVRYGFTFVLFIVSGTLFSLLTDIYLALRRAEYSFIQGLIVGMLKLGLIIVLARLFSIFGILASWTAATAVAVLLGLFLFLVRLQPAYRPLPVLRLHSGREMMRFSFRNYVSLGLWLIPGWILPVLVLNEAGSHATAFFFMGWSFASLLFAIPTATANSLFAEGSHRQTHLAGDVKRSLKLIAVIALPAAMFLLLAGDKLLLLFGRQYSEESTKVLWLLVPAIVPLSLNVLYMAVAKVRKRMGEVIIISAVISAVTLTLAYVMISRLGILGAGAAWLSAQTLVALFLLPRFIGLLREKEKAGTSE